jgi:cell wall assembly regulator SMI1
VTLEEIHGELAFFRPGVVRLNPPAEERDIAKAEAELDVVLAPSMRVALRAFNGGFVVNEPLLGVPPIQSALDAVFATRQARTHWGALGWSHAFVEIGGDGCGNPYVLLLDRQDQGGDAPVGFFDAGVMEVTEVVASSYLHFVWFMIQDVKWYYQADGRPVVREDVRWSQEAVVVRPEALSPWRFNEAWMLAHDPALARWR